MNYTMVKSLQISHLKVCGSKCYILNTKDQLDKLDSKSQNGIFFGYSLNSSSYRVYILENLCVEEPSNDVLDEVKVTKEVELTMMRTKMR